MRRAIRSLLILAVVTAGYLFGALERFEHALMDARFRASATTASPTLVLVEIDEPSLRALPVWPWPRRFYAQALHHLAAAGAARVAIDVDLSSRSNPDDDRILAQALRASALPVILPVFRQSVKRPDGTHQILESRPLPEFSETTTLTAFNVRPDSDGKVRRLYTRERWSDRIVPHYAATIAGRQADSITEYYIDYAIDPDGIPRLRFSDVAAGRFDPTLVEGREIVIGASAVQLGDMVSVPVYRSLPGAVVQALGYSSLKLNRAIQRLHPGFMIGICVLVLALLHLIGKERGWRYSLGASLGVIAVSTVAAVGIQMDYPIYVDLAPLVAVVALDILTRLFSLLRRQDIRLLTQSLALRRRDMMMRLVVENSFDAIFTLNMSGEVLTYNHAAEEIFGYEGSEIIGQNVDTLLPDLTIANGGGIEDLMARRGIHEIRCRHRSGKDLILDLSIAQIRIEEDSILIFLARDITEKRTAEVRAREARERLAEAVESIDAGFALFGAKDRLVLANGRYLAKGIIGNRLPARPTFEEIVRVLAEDGYFAAARENPDRWINERIAHHRAAESAAVDQTTDGRWILTSARRTHDGGTIVIETDITVLKEREAELVQARDQAESANRMKSEFLATMSHELRTPLNAIIGFSEMMTTQVFGPIGHESYTGYARDIHGSGKHLLSIINSILDMAKIESGQFDLREEWLSLKEAVGDVVRLVHESARKQDVALNTTLPDSGLGLMADTRLVRQILLNLLSNAIKFTPEGGRVDVSQDRLPDGSCRITIADTGIGMSPEDLVKALEPFGQVQSSLSRVYEGTGLGLTLTQRFLELHGGRLDIETAPGRGTCAHAIFPPERVISRDQPMATAQTV